MGNFAAVGFLGGQIHLILCVRRQSINWNDHYATDEVVVVIWRQQDHGNGLPAGSNLSAHVRQRSPR